MQAHVGLRARQPLVQSLAAARGLSLPQSTVRCAGLGRKTVHVHLLQAVSKSETEVTTQKVQMTAATKQAEKLSKGLLKTQQEVDEAVQGMEAKQQEQQARSFASLGPAS